MDRRDVQPVDRLHKSIACMRPLLRRGIDAARALAVAWGPKAERRRTAPANWKLPERWNRGHDEFFAQHGRRRRVFCASLSDVFDNQVPATWRADLFQLIERTPNLDWLLLTKRVGNVPAMMLEVARHLFWMDDLETPRLRAKRLVGSHDLRSGGGRPRYPEAA
ncbi:hypothetical protein AWV80_35680 [Cupriavidus sp. UYMU48A]|nr:hypothetical protein AWV80_35680 [Cupriavidus sp. UYMU48A]